MGQPRAEPVVEGLQIYSSSSMQPKPQLNEADEPIDFIDLPEISLSVALFLG